MYQLFTPDPDTLVRNGIRCMSSTWRQLLERSRYQTSKTQGTRRMSMVISETLSGSLKMTVITSVVTSLEGRGWEYHSRTPVSADCTGVVPLVPKIWPRMNWTICIGKLKSK